MLDSLSLSPDNQGLLLSLGATHVIDYRSDVPAALKDLLPNGVNYILECVSSAVSGQSA